MITEYKRIEWHKIKDKLVGYVGLEKWKAKAVGTKKQLNTLKRYEKLLIQNIKDIHGVNYKKERGKFLSLFYDSQSLLNSASL
jgi:hypothetical protein